MIMPDSCDPEFGQALRRDKLNHLIIKSSQQSRDFGVPVLGIPATLI